MVIRETLAAALAADLNATELLTSSCVNPINQTIDPNDDSVETFAIKWQLYNLNRKANPGFVQESHVTAAFEKFQELQQHMRIFNERLSHVQPVWLNKARLIIRDLLPPLHFVEDDIMELCDYGPGASHGTDKKLKLPVRLSLHYKIGGNQTVTEEAKHYALRVIAKHFPAVKDNLISNGSTLSVISGNRLAYVPKDVSKCRPIAVEPSLNTFLQQGVGRWLGTYMRSANFANIYDQSRNRLLAGDLGNATIDLSNASDTISTKLVEFLIPSDWFALLDLLRSKRWSFRGKQGIHEGFSTQGNAFTFPLETLIFKSVLMAALNLSKDEITVYGDDIILRDHYFDDAVTALKEAGFFVNRDKSYSSHHDHNTHAFNFRESCGADYYKEVLVTPVYYRDNVKTYSDIATLYNMLLERWGILPNTFDYLLSLIPKKKRLWGPSSIITDQPHKYRERSTLPTSFNSVVRVYDAWIHSNEYHSEKPSGRRWMSITRQLKAGDLLSKETSLRTILYGAHDVAARSSRLVTAPCDPIKGPEDVAINYEFRLKGRGLPWQVASVGFSSYREE